MMWKPRSPCSAWLPVRRARVGRGAPRGLTHGMVDDVEAALAVQRLVAGAAGAVGAGADGGHDDAVVGANLFLFFRVLVLGVGDDLPGEPDRQSSGCQPAERLREEPAPG